MPHFVNRDEKFSLWKQSNESGHSRPELSGLLGYISYGTYNPLEGCLLFGCITEKEILTSMNNNLIL